MKKLLFCILWILSRSPIFSVTLDRNFHNITAGKFYDPDFSYSELRFSIVSLGLGTVKVYIGTYKKGDKPNLIKLIFLSNVAKIPKEEEVCEKINNYGTLLEGKKTAEIEYEIDFLKYMISQRENTKSIALNKATNYTAIILVFIPLLLTNGLKFVFNLRYEITTIIAGIVLYHLLNISILILGFYAVKSFSRSGFKELKESSKHLNKLAESYYKDWYCVKEEAPVFVSYISNIERYMKMMILFIILFIGFNNITNTFDYTVVNKVLDVSRQADYCIDISILEDGTLHKEDLAKLLKVHNNLLDAHIDQIVILHSPFKTKLTKEKYHNIIDTLKEYNVNYVKLIEVVQDNKQETADKSDTIQFIMIGVK